MSDAQESDDAVDRIMHELAKLPPLKYAAAVHVLERIAAGEDRTTEEWLAISEELIAGGVA